MRRITLTLVVLLCFHITASNTTPHYGEERSERLIKEAIEMFWMEEVNSMIKHIEFKSEVKIPHYVDFKYVDYMYHTAIHFNIPIRIAFRLVHTESRFRDTVVSNVGAYGFTQLMPQTFEMMKLELNNPNLKIDNNFDNIYVGFYFLKYLHNFWVDKGKTEEDAWKLTLASYNAGIGRVFKYKGIPPFKETRKFVKFINKKHSNTKEYEEYLDTTPLFGKKYNTYLYIN